MAEPKNTPDDCSTEGTEAAAARTDALTEQITALRRAADRRAVSRRIDQLLGRQAKFLPADMPLHKRVFGVMDED